MTRNQPIPNIPKHDQAFVRSLVVHEDQDVIVFNKPSGLPVQTRGNRSKNLDYLLWTFAKSNGKRPKLVQRIDAETSGIVIVAKTHSAAVFLSQIFADHKAEKIYHAIVEGEIPHQSKGIIEVPLIVSPNDPSQNVVLGRKGMENAKNAKTKWKVIARNKHKAIIELIPKTGRTHQLRVHLTSIGCSILGDRMYGTGRLSAQRLMLHATRLSISTPKGGKMNFEAHWPEDFKNKSIQYFQSFVAPVNT